MTPKTLLTLSLALLLSACSATLTVRNDRPGPVKDIKVRVPGAEYTVPELAPGATHVQKVNVAAPGPLGLDYTDENGRLNINVGPVPLKKGDSRRWLLRLDPKAMMVMEPAP